MRPIVKLTYKRIKKDKSYKRRELAKFSYYPYERSYKNIIQQSKTCSFYISRLIKNVLDSRPYYGYYRPSLSKTMELALEQWQNETD